MCLLCNHIQLQRSTLYLGTPQRKFTVQDINDKKPHLHSFLRLLNKLSADSSLSVVLCKDQRSEKNKLVLCAILEDKELNSSNIIPLAELFSKDPYESLVPIEVISCQGKKDLESNVVFQSSLFQTVNLNSHEPPRSSKSFN